jgi:Cathepsin propeptide inhibitor domain (I29)
MRRQIWEENVINIDNHNAEFLDGKQTYKQTENFFTDMVIIVI